MNIFRVITGNKHKSQQSETTPTSSQPASPLPAGRAGRLQRQNALSPDVRYSAHSFPSTPERARARERYHDEGSSSAQASSSVSSSSALLRQGGGREHGELARFHDMMTSSAKMSRSDPLPENPELLPARLQQKMNNVDLSKLEKLDKDLFNYANLATDLAKRNLGTDARLTKMDIKMLPLIADAENARNPGLNLHVFKRPDECYEAIKEQGKQVRVSKQPVNMRVIYPPFIGAPDHHVALDILFRPGHRPSVVGFESAPGNLLGLLISSLDQNLKGFKIRPAANIIQQSNWDCSMYAMNNVLKSFKHYDDYTSRLHQGEKDLEPPPEFLKHAQSRGTILGSPHQDAIVTKDKGGLHSETLLHRNMAYRAQRSDRAYSTSIEGFRFQEISRAGEFLAAKRGRN